MLNFLGVKPAIQSFQIPDSLLAPVIGAIAATIVVLHYVLRIAKVPREPPFVPQKIPYVGHLIGILRHGTKYYDSITAKYSLSAYSLAMPQGRMYIINSPDLVMSVQRNSKTLSSAPFAAKYAARVVEVSKETEAIWFNNVTGENGRGSLFVDGMKAMQASLAPGNLEFDNLVRAMLNSFLEPCQVLDEEKEKRRLSLMEWLRDELTLAATNAIYGKMNPFKARAIRNGFWDFYRDFTMLLVNVFPTFTASAGYKGRLACFEAVEEYLRNGGASHESSGLLKALVNTSAMYGVCQKDIAHFDILNVQAALSNVIPTAFWTLYHICSRPDLLLKVRLEIQRCVSTENSENLDITSLDVAKLRTSCPLIHSVFQESLRVHSYNASVRAVLKDTVLQGRYLLKQGAVVHMPSHVIHNDISVWGVTAKEFEADRFVPKSSSSSAKEQKYHAGAFRAFGGGSTLCPGRHFATTTIITIVAMLVLRYHIVPKDGGKWKSHTQKRNHLVAAILPPDQDVEVEIIPRKTKKEIWKFVMGNSTSATYSVVE